MPEGDHLLSTPFSSPAGVFTALPVSTEAEGLASTPFLSCQTIREPAVEGLERGILGDLSEGSSPIIVIQLDSRKLLARRPTSVAEFEVEYSLPSLF